MGQTRRDFISLAAVGAALDLSRIARLRGTDSTLAASAVKPQRILILGGTGLIGPHLVRHALARGHTVTLFNRGKTNPELFRELEQLRGDRSTGDLQALQGRSGTR